MVSARHSGTEPPPAPASTELDDETLLREGGAALEQRLGRLGMLRHLRLLTGGRDRFEDIRERWANLTVDEILDRMARPDLVAR